MQLVSVAGLVSSKIERIQYLHADQGYANQRNRKIGQNIIHSLSKYLLVLEKTIN